MAITTANVSSGNVTTYISSSDSAVTFMSLCNHDAVDVTIDIYIVPDGTTPSVDNLLIKDLEIIAGDTYIMYKGGEKIILGNNDAFVVASSVAGAVSVITSFVAV